MQNSILQRIVSALTADDVQDNRYFYAAGELVPANIKIEVAELGPLTFPLKQEDIEKLISISSKAQFGLYTQTILDENIRNTQEITSDKLQITINEHSLAHLLGKMRNAIGLSKDSVLIPHLHNFMLNYDNAINELSTLLKMRLLHYPGIDYSKK